MTTNTSHIHRDVTLAIGSYSRTDYTALRAYCLKLPIDKIEQLYYSEDDFPNDRFKTLEQFLIFMRHDLIERAIGKNPEFANILASARLGGNVTAKALDILVQAVDAKKETPLPTHPLSRWLRKNTAKPFKDENILSIQDLLSLINSRGPGWWRSIPRIGKLRANIIVNWLRQHATSIGDIKEPIRYKKSNESITKVNLSILSQVVPLEYMTANEDLDGSQGENRSFRFPYIQAKNDFCAVSFFLSKFESEPNTFRNYRKELERFLLWAILILRKPISSLNTNDCLKYADFLKSPCPTFIGVKSSRDSTLWRPFTSKIMSINSQNRAIQIIKSLFNYLVSVRYLNSNPWMGHVSRKSNIKSNPESNLSFLSCAAYEELISNLALESQYNDPRVLIAHASILLMGDSGLLLSEIVKLKCSDLKLSDEAPGFLIASVSNRGSVRNVPINPRTVSLIKSLWKDVNSSFLTLFDTPLFQRPRGQKQLDRNKHDSDQLLCSYTPDGLYKLIKRAIAKLNEKNKLGQQYSNEYLSITPYTLRHTFGIISLESGMPIEVLTNVMGVSELTILTTYSKRILNKSEDSVINSKSLKFFLK